MTILAQRPTHVSAVAIVLLTTKRFTVKYYDRRIHTNTVSVIIITLKNNNNNNNNNNTYIHTYIHTYLPKYIHIKRDSWTRAGFLFRGSGREVGGEQRNQFVNIWRPPFEINEHGKKQTKPTEIHSQ